MHHEIGGIHITMIEIGDIHITMDDLGDIHITKVCLHRTVHILHIICIHLLHDANDLEYTTGSMLTRIVNIEPVSLSLVIFMLEQRKMTREIGSWWSNGE